MVVTEENLYTHDFLRIIIDREFQASVDHACVQRYSAGRLDTHTTIFFQVYDHSDPDYRSLRRVLDKAKVIMTPSLLSF